MLVLSRKLGQVIVVDGGITITVVELKGDRVCLGIEAPPTTAVHRFEVAQRIEDEARRAALAPHRELVACPDCGLADKIAESTAEPGRYLCRRCVNDFDHAATPSPPAPLAGGLHPVRRDARRANGEDTR